MKRFLTDYAKRQLTTLKSTETKTLSQVTKKDRIFEKKHAKQQELLKTFNTLVEQKKTKSELTNSRSIKAHTMETLLHDKPNAQHQHRRN